jgi:hypothetical protein
VSCEVAGTRDGARLVDRVCENCTFPDEELALVRRAYVTPESWDTKSEIRVLDDTELWCMSCRSQYPHQLVEDDED